MEYIVEEIGTSRTVSDPSIAVTLLRVVGAKVYEVQEGGRALVAYSKGKANNRCTTGMQKRYSLSAEFNKFATLEITNTEAGDLDKSPLNEAKILKVNFNPKGRGYSGIMRRHNLGGGSVSHGSRSHRRRDFTGNRERPGRVQPGMRMAGHYGDAKVNIKNELISHDAGNKILVLRGAVPGFNGVMDRIRIAKWVR